jgi:hypothetical protein
LIVLQLAFNAQIVLGGNQNFTGWNHNRITAEIR